MRDGRAETEKAIKVSIRETTPEQIEEIRKAVESTSGAFRTAESDADRIAQCPHKDSATPSHEDMAAILADCLATALADLDAERAATVEERAARVAAETERDTVRAALEKERAATMRELADLRRRMVDAERNERDMGERMVAALHERDALAGTVDAGRAELMRIASERAAKVAEVTAERDQERRAVDDLMSDLREMEARAASAETTLRETTAALSAVTVERDGLRDRLAQTVAERDAWKTRAATLVAERDEKIRAAEERALRAGHELDAAWKAAEVPVRGMVTLAEVIESIRTSRRDEWASRISAERERDLLRADVAHLTAQLANAEADRREYSEESAEALERLGSSDERALRAERDLDVEAGLSVMRLERADRYAADLAYVRQQLETVRQVVMHREAELAESTAAVRGLAKEGLDVRAERQRLAADGERLAGLIERYAVVRCEECGRGYTVAEYAALEPDFEGCETECRKCMCGAGSLVVWRKVTP